MIKLKDILFESISPIKWIVGIVDNYGRVHHKVVKQDDPLDSHFHLWPTVHHGKWRWMPSRPNALNTYGEPIDDDAVDSIWQIIDQYRE